MIVDFIPLDDKIFECITEYGKLMKSTFIVVDPYSPHKIYGFNGDALSYREAYIGCLKLLNYDAFSTVLGSMPSYNFVAMSKDFIAMNKLRDEKSKIFLEASYIGNRVLINGVHLIKDGATISTIPTFKANKFYLAYKSMINNLVINNMLDITNDEELISILEHKSKDGAFLLHDRDTHYYITPNMLNINKNDKVFAGYTEESLPRIQIDVIKKKYTISTIFKAVQL